MPVTVVMPAFNSVLFISASINSVLSQTYQDWELIIVDDFSVDNSSEIVQSFMLLDPRIQFIPLVKNVGAAEARNIAIKAAKTRYIAFLDSDDVWLPYKLEKQLAFMEVNNYPFSYSSYDKIDEHGQVIEHVGVPDKVSYTDLLKTNSIGCLTAIYDADYFGKVYMPTNTKREDFATWLQLLKRVEYAHGLNETLAQYRVYSNQSSAKKMNMAAENWRLYRQIEELNLLKASYYFLHYIVKGLLRTKAPRLAKILGVLK